MNANIIEWGLHNSEVWVGDRRNYKAVIVTLEREIYKDKDSETPESIDRLGWAAEAIPAA